MHLSKSPITEPIEISEGQYVESAIDYLYLGVLFIRSDELIDHIRENISHRKVHLHKFYAWLEYNADTPIQIKLLVLYGCVFEAMYYCSETWYVIDSVSEEMLLIERKALKRCLGVKSSTPDDMIYTELNRSNIINAIKDRQHTFFNKLPDLEGSAIVCDILDMCAELDVVQYYNLLSDTHCADEINERKERMKRAESTHIKRYNDITNLEYCHTLYECYLREDLRTIITRWRLSCIPLSIETGRYKDIEREMRLCPFCGVLEDEEHALFVCDAYREIRKNYQQLFQDNSSVKEFLNPKDNDTAYSLGCLLKEIEDRRQSLVGRHSG